MNRLNEMFILAPRRSPEVKNSLSYGN
eukprot:CCRYP_011419-RA/>CCRYP_011419-RA protein AED:0.32 eAED:0.32 QI:122/1/0.5/1/0/0/2/0/26